MKAKILKSFWLSIKKIKFFRKKKIKKVLVIKSIPHYSLGMSLLPFPADSAEYEEYCEVMNAMADEAEASTPDPEPEDFGGRCEDAPCCGCCGNEPSDYTPDEAAEYYRSMYECEEDRYDDSVDFEDRYDVSEYGMDGCCGDF